MQTSSTTVPGPITADTPVDERPFLQRLSGIVLYKKQLLAWMFVGIALGVLYLALAQKRYTANTKLMPPRNIPSSAALLARLSSTDAAGSLAAVASGGLSLRNPNDIYLAMLNSRTVADTLIKNFDLQTVYRTPLLSNTEKELAKYTVISSDKEGTLSISVTDVDKKRAADLANAYVEQLSRLTKTLSSEEAGSRVAFYKSELEHTNTDLANAEAVLQRVQQSKGLVQLDAQAKVAIEGVARLRAQMATKEVEVASLRSVAGSANPRLALAERELSALRAEAAHVEQGSGGAGSADLGLKNLPVSGIDFLHAQREVEYQQALYSIFMRQFEAAKLDESRDSVIIQVLDRAIIPDRKSSPKTTITLLLSAILGFAFGSAYLAATRKLETDEVLARDLRLFLRNLKAW